MKKKTEILTHLNTYQQKAVENGKDAGKMETLMTPLYNAVDEYYSKDYTTGIANCVKSLTHCLLRCGIRYKGQPPASVGAGLCRGWDNVTDLFLADEVIINTGYADFYNSITEETAVDETTGESTSYYKSTLFESWAVLLLSDAELITQDLAAIANTASTKGLNDSLADAFEPKEIISVPDMQDIAKQIYIDRRYKELINYYGLNVFVPSFL